MPAGAWEHLCDGGSPRAVAAVFKGQAISALDGKGRFSLPAAFRSVLADNSEQSGIMQLRADPDRGYLSLFGDKVLKAFEEENAEKARSADSRGVGFDREQFDADFFGSIEEASIDSGGRFSIPAKLREPYGISDGIFLVGAARIVQLWAPERFLASDPKSSIHIAACHQFIAELEARRGGAA